MQPLDTLTSSLADSLTSAADSLLQADSLVNAAARDSSLLSDSAGIGALGQGVEQAGKLLAKGEVESAASVFAAAAFRFTLEHLVPALLVGLLFYGVYRVVRGVLGQTLSRSSRIDAGVQGLILRVVRMALAAFGAVTVLGELGINVTALVAGLGIAGIALGFAARDTLENLIAGVTILIDRPFRVGDNIELQETFGTVEEITLRTTRVRTLDNQMAILPNAKVITDKILNHTMLRALRVCIPFGIAYKESPAAARAVVLALAKGDKRLHPDHPAIVVVTDLGDSSVNMELRLFLKDGHLEVPIRLDYQERVFDALKQAGIEIPFPHLQLFIDEAKAFRGTTFLGDGGA